MIPEHNSLLSILIVEDNPGDLFLLEETLGLTRLPIEHIYRARSAAEAIDVLSANRVSVVLLDLSLPDSSGFNSFVNINEYASTIPIIVLTGLADMEMALETMANGAQDYLIKSEFDERLLSKSIQYSIERNRIRESLRESNESYRNLFFNNPLPIFIWNPDNYEILELNDVAHEQYGYTRQELLQMTVLELRDETDFDKIKEFAREFKQTGVVRKSGIWTHRKKNGEAMILDIRSTGHS